VAFRQLGLVLPRTASRTNAPSERHIIAMMKTTMTSNLKTIDVANTLEQLLRNRQKTIQLGAYNLLPPNKARRKALNFVEFKGLF
jgi:hypothetical protein